MARTLNEWFSLYGESHQNKTNKQIHFACVPAIYFSIMGILWSLPTPSFLPGIINWVSVSLAIALWFYWKMAPSIMVGMAVFSGLCFALLGIVDAMGISVLWFSIIIFVIAWILQFYGHAVEGKKPSFFEDLQFLLVGPAWILGFIYRRAGIQLA
ncbi:MAG TPA: Mpo1-like protein [Dongiaceae bacterium]|nr:Mpo1-like protein [Dongiaceae bacterium]